MENSDLPPAVQKLTTLGDAWEYQDWVDYRLLGIEEKHIPFLIQIINDHQQFWEKWEEDDPRGFTPVHAWRALGQLRAVEAIPTLISLLREIDDDDNDLIQEDLPEVLALIGPAAVPALIDYLNNPENPVWARLAASKSLKKIGLAHPDVYRDVVQAYANILNGYTKNDLTFNGFIILHVAYLRAKETYPLVEQAFKEGWVDPAVMGDWEDFQVEVGLLKKRKTKRDKNQIFDSLLLEADLDSELENQIDEDELWDLNLLDVDSENLFMAPDMDENKVQQFIQRDARKEKNKRKLEKQSRKKNRKKKGK